MPGCTRETHNRLPNFPRGCLMSKIALTEERVARADCGDLEELWVHDTRTPHLALRIYRSGKKAYYAIYRPNGGGRKAPVRKLKIGSVDIGLSTARKLALQLMGQVAEGLDPAAERAINREKETVSELCTRFIDDHVKVFNKPSTQKETQRLINREIIPALGTRRAVDLTRQDVTNWHLKMRETPYSANRYLAALSKMLNFAGIEPNPCRGVKKFPEPQRHAFFTDSQLGEIAKAVFALEQERKIPPGARIVIQILGGTGMRLGEVLSLKWENVDLERRFIRLPDSKTGPRAIAIAPEIVDVFKGAEEYRTTGPYVVIGSDPQRPFSGHAMQKYWGTIRDRAGLPNTRMHDFRHTIGTRGSLEGRNAYEIRDLLGHSSLAMGNRYVERNPVHMLAVASSVGGPVARLMAANTLAVHLSQNNIQAD